MRKIEDMVIVSNNKNIAGKKLTEMGSEKNSFRYINEINEVRHITSEYDCCMKFKKYREYVVIDANEKGCEGYYELIFGINDNDELIHIL
jgi:hypothetical protein